MQEAFEIEKMNMEAMNISEAEMAELEEELMKAFESMGELDLESLNMTESELEAELEAAFKEAILEDLSPEDLNNPEIQAFLEGMDIPIYYDPMIAKLVVWGKNRKSAIKRTIKAINEYQISGLKTTLDFGKYVLKHEAFVSGDFDTNFCKHYFDEDPKVIYTAMDEEESALKHGINQIWDDIKQRDREEYASREMESSWRNSRS